MTRRKITTRRRLDRRINLEDGVDASDFIAVGTYVVFGIVALIIGAAVVAGVAGYFHRSTTTTVVVDKERVCDRGTDGDQDCKYLVFTDDGTFEITDSLVAGRFTSSDFYGRVRRCHRYEITHYGFRSGISSWYPNITDMVDLGRADGCEP